ncbi:hypothetical protein Hypma_014137 [Hypsizygus marmoreus]|uniref:Uncharacterized protein n=1 Tax=Hypsizygus marmoreus TaxID=39966 RepID=A0A369KDQ5_HYPMA|nr:hypothetical protein Hypma_014137 [Hypsizygus marmoreus]
MPPPHHVLPTPPSRRPTTPDSTCLPALAPPLAPTTTPDNTTNNALIPPPRSPTNPADSAINTINTNATNSNSAWMPDSSLPAHSTPPPAHKNIHPLAGTHQPPAFRT